MRYIMSFATPLPNRVPRPDVVIDSARTDLRFSNMSPGGFAGLEAGMAFAQGGQPVVGVLPPLVHVGHRDQITVRAEGASQIIWEGRVQKIRRGAGGLVTGITGIGYFSAFDDDWWRDATETTTLSTGALLRRLIEDRFPFFRVGNAEQFIDPNVQWSDGIGRFYRYLGIEIIQMFMTAAVGSADPAIVTVWEGPTVWLTPDRAVATYTVPFDERVLTWEEDNTEMVSHLAVEYEATVAQTTSTGQSFPNPTTQTTYQQLPQITAEAENVGFLETWGFESRKRIAMGRMPSAADSVPTSVRNRELARRARPNVRATIQVTSDPATWLTRGTTPWPPYLYRAGIEGVQVADYPPMRIANVSVDANDGEFGSATVELGDIDPSLPKNQTIRAREFTNLLQRFVAMWGGRLR